MGILKLSKVECNSVRWDRRSTGVEYCVYDQIQVASLKAIHKEKKNRLILSIKLALISDKSYWFSL
jgi:hypothetical protein